MTYQFTLQGSGILAGFSDDPLEQSAKTGLLKTALEEGSKIGLDISIRAGGSLWSAIFSKGDNLAGTFSTSVKSDDVSVDFAIEISIDRLPPKVGKAVKLGDYQISISGLSVSGYGLIADNEIRIPNPQLTIS